MPFEVNASGAVMITLDPDVQTEQHLESLVTTQPGARVMMPSYGVDTISRVFAPGDEIVQADLVTEVQQQVSLWEPNVNVQSITPIPSLIGEYGTSSVAIDWVQGAVSAFTQVQTATILVGGTVISDVTS